MDSDCTEASELLGSYTYLNGVGWFPSGGSDIQLYPGMGLRLETTNSGWFKWGVPPEE